ncbi:helix-turn-helix domain-containing protein [Legionella sp.]|uniref:helix-turn-helix domain-containing protein n=1 Tax=Legionella sp. TaxID=459 RepID=UPI003CBBAA5A
MNDIKKLIGQRIQVERKAKGLTQAKLAELAGGLKQPRVNNWEQGIRTPGPEEIKQLAKVLEVSPAFLMCLTDRKQPHPLDKNYVGALMPLLSPEQLDNPQHWIQSIREGEYDGEITFIPITIELAKVIGDNAFALKMEDESMEPELRPDDVLIVNPDATPKPGNIVVVKSDGNPEVIIRRYKQLSISKSSLQFELLATNKNWAAIQSHELVGCKILGTVINLSRQIA